MLEAPFTLTEVQEFMYLVRKQHLVRKQQLTLGVYSVKGHTDLQNELGSPGSPLTYCRIFLKFNLLADYQLPVAEVCWPLKEGRKPSNQLHGLATNFHTLITADVGVYLQNCYCWSWEDKSQTSHVTTCRYQVKGKHSATNSLVTYLYLDLSSPNCKTGII